MSGLEGYDQWKTASPYDDDVDLNATCPECGSPQYVEGEYHGDWVDLTCDDCGHEYKFNPFKPVLTEEEQKRLESLRDRLNKLDIRRWVDRPGGLITLEQLFEYAPEGDFSWDGEAGDWHVYNCGEKDCGWQWHKISYYEELGRRGGKRWIKLGSVDEDGNSDVDLWWDESEGDDIASFYWIALSMAEKLPSFFKGWAEYYLDAAVTGEDVLGEFMDPPEMSRRSRECMTAAEENIKQLEDLLKRD